jgi:uncharacterized protein YpmS
MDKNILKSVIADNQTEVPKYKVEVSDKVIEVVPVWKWLLNL